MPVERRLKLPIEHPVIRSALESGLRKATESANKGYYGDSPRIQGGYRKERSQLQHTLKTGEVTPAASHVFYDKIGMPKLDRRLGMRMDEQLKRHYELPPGVAAQVKGALLQHELDTGRLVRPEHGYSFSRDEEFRRKVLPEFIRKTESAPGGPKSREELKQAIRFVVRKEENRAGAGWVRKEEAKARRGVRPKRQLREEIAKSLRQMKQQPQAP